MTMRADQPVVTRSQGFTLVELLVTMAIAMVILAGLYSNFLLQSRVQARQASTVDVLEDMRLTSQIMGNQLKLAHSICWTGNTLIYQPLGATTMTTADCNAGTVYSDWGAFKFNAGAICWDMPNQWNTNGNYGCSQVLQGLNASTGLQVSPPGNTNFQALRTVTLVGQYKTVDRQSKNLQIAFDVLPRN